jgi:glycosyltransferase involved in cell wall biosynthesis
VKVLVALHDYLPRHAGGSEVHAHEVAAELARRGHAVTAAFTERDLAAPEGELRRGVLDNVTTLEVVHQREYADVRETWEQAPALAAFRAILAEVAPDVVHFHHLSLWGSGALVAAKEAGARVVLTLHDYHLLCDAAVLLRRDGELCLDGPLGACADCLRRHPVLLERWAEATKDAAYARAARERHARHRTDLAAVDVAIAPSRFLGRAFCDAGMLDPAQVVHLRYGYPGPRREARASDPARPLRVGYVGGIYRSKGVHVLVEAFGHLRGVDATLAIHGHLDWFPDYVAELRAAAAGLPVELAGPFSRAELDAVLAGFDVLVCPSVWYENLPLTIQEAYRNGVPVIATDLGGMAESVEDGVSGLLFPRGDAAALAERVARVARDRGLLAKLASGVPSPPALEEVVDRIERLYAGGDGLSGSSPSRSRG